MKINKLITPYNRTVSKGRSIKYLVIHYVGATGGAEANCKYYANNKLSASAHYFVGHAGEIWQSVEDKDIAWHCGAKSCRHKSARNSNSIGIELCCRKNPWRFEQATVDSAVELVQYLMAKYGIPAQNIIRHYDVTGKNCPAPYVSDTAAWNAFRARCRGEKAQTVTSTVQVSSTKSSIAFDPLIKEYQQALNSQYGKGLAADGIYGSKTEAAAVSVRKGFKGAVVTVLQKLLSSRTDYFGGAWDGIFGVITETAVMRYQKNNGLAVDGIVGKKTWRHLLTRGN